ncbi:glutamyl-tRNA amidotransferase subunit A [Aulographum hederae CBS 113979]|uniref:Glutamyl-tRNA amidotransferase subunit A n=1 Tax=Aulographum hederae CBS 113979 TaxID=1176131 RepID=A0A6G1GMC0_9PEZI|nr:glutamyl-tRNA amidotransferase subunit A [Aulographum hederae CBS 113979]
MGMLIAWIGAFALLFIQSLALPEKYTASPIDVRSPWSNATEYQQILDDPFPYEFPDQDLAETTALFPMPKCHGITLEEATIDQLQDYMGSGLLTSTQLATCYMNRIYQTDDYINSVLEINPDWLSIATSLDAERSSGKVRGPLHGIPYMVKDNIATRDKMETTAGSYALLGSIVPRDAFVISRLRAAGALLLGKATLSEWADMRSNNYSEGYSARGGQARSPYNLTLNPGGSSSGSAAGVAANCFTFALGTETDGSIINPAERNAVVGFKPTVGLTSRAGVIPESIHQDTVGPFARTFRDTVYVLDAIYGPDPRDNYTLAQIGQTPTDGYLQFLTSRHALQNATFGIPWSTSWIYADEDQQNMLLELIELIKDAGATVINGTELPSASVVVSPGGWNWDFGTTRGYPNESEYTVVKVDFYNNIRDYLSELNNTNIKSIEDIIAYNEDNDGSEGGFPWPRGIPAFYSGQDGFIASQESGGVMDETYYQALGFMHRMTREEGIDAALGMGPGGSKLDALLVPPDVGQTYQVAAQAGYPMVTLPVGVHGETGMPFGLGLMQSAFQEDQIVKWASAIEDLQMSSGTRLKRTLPKWYGYLEKNVPVFNL